VREGALEEYQEEKGVPTASPSPNYSSPNQPAPIHAEEEQGQDMYYLIPYYLIEPHYLIEPIRVRVRYLIEPHGGTLLDLGEGSPATIHRRQRPHPSPR